jgi:hypothetical protein
MPRKKRKRRRKNLHAEILGPFATYVEANGATTQNYSIGRSMPRALKGHPDMVVFEGGVTTFVEVKPDVHGTARLTDGQCEWYWKFEHHFCGTIRYIIAGSFGDLVERYHYGDDVSMPDQHRRRLDRYGKTNTA